MAKKKLLVSDLDGTLIRNNQISQEDRMAIQDFNEEGHVFAIATGRNYYDFMRAERFFKIPYDYLILNGGSLILDKNKRVIFSESIKAPRLVDTIIKVLHEVGAINTVLFISYEKSMVNMAYPWDNTFILANINSICLDFREERSEKVAETYSYLCKEAQCAVIQNGLYIDILPKGLSKETAILELLKEIGIPLADLITIGDDWNDIPMFEMTENSFVIRSQKMELLTKAHNVVASLAECLSSQNLDADNS